MAAAISQLERNGPRPLSADEARNICGAIREHYSAIGEHATEVRSLLILLHDGRGWAALGYNSWRECAVAEFGMSERTAYRQLEAARIEQDFCQVGKNEAPPTDSHLLALAPLPTAEQRREAWEEAKAEAPNGRPKAEDLKAKVDRKLGREPKPKAPAKVKVRTEPEAEGIDFGEPAEAFGEATPEPERPIGKSRVNGVLVDDPPDVAAQRAAGRLAPDVIPDIKQDEPATADEPEPEAKGEPTDAEWLESLPVRAELPEAMRARFDEDALLYRHLEPHRKTLAHHATRLMNRSRRKGHYHRIVLFFLKRDHPKHWLRCPDTEHGGCGGSGQIDLLGECPKCRGLGYWIK